MFTSIEQLALNIETFLDDEKGFDSIADVYAVLGNICRDKAEHVRAGWQDEVLAYLWERFAKACDTAGLAFDNAVKRID